MGGIESAYLNLRNGGSGLDLALSVTAGTMQDRARILRLVATSDGARADQVARALALVPDDGLDTRTLLPTMALIARTGGDTAPYEQRAAKLLGEESDRVLKAFELLRKRASAAEVDNALRGLNMEFRAEIYVAAAVLYGNHCPPEWHEIAKRMLFTTERPYLR